MKSHYVTMLLRILAAMLAILLGVSAVQAQNPYSDCPPNSSTIWILREQHQGVGFPAHPVEVEFENDLLSWDPYEGVWITNYLGGVLEGEIAGSAETQWWEWQKETGQTLAIAARTVAYGGCGERTVAGYPGMDDHSRQHYWPGHTSQRAADYRKYAQDTAGQYVIHNGQIIAINSMRYNNYTGTPTQNLQSSGPLKGVSDPVASSDEQQNPGMGQHSANHWFAGEHNVNGCESSWQCLNPSPSHTWTWADNVRWMDHREALAHYYTDIHISDANAGNAILTPDRRWNALEIDNQPPGPVSPATSHPFDVWLQNTGVDDWSSGYYALSYQICQYGVCTINTNANQRQVLATNVPPGDDVLVSINVFFPSYLRGTVSVRFDMVKLRNPWGGLDVWFANAGWPTQDVSVCVGGCVHLPSLLRRFGSRQVGRLKAS